MSIYTLMILMIVSISTTALICIGFLEAHRKLDKLIEMQQSVANLHAHKNIK